MNTRQFSLASLLLLTPLFIASHSAQADGNKGAKAQNVPVIPPANAIIKVELFPDTNAISGHGAKLDANKFKYLLSTAKLLSPAEAKDIRKQWQYAPYYHGTLTTKKGTYSFYLFLGGLGAITPPNQPERSFTFEQPK